MKKRLAIVLALAMVLMQVGAISFAAPARHPDVEINLDQENVISPFYDIEFRRACGEDERSYVPFSIDDEVKTHGSKPDYIFYYAPWEVLKYNEQRLNTYQSGFQFQTTNGKVVNAKQLRYRYEVVEMDESEKAKNKPYEYSVVLTIEGFPEEYNKDADFDAFDRMEHEDKVDYLRKLWKVYGSRSQNEFLSEEMGIASAEIQSVTEAYTGGEIIVRNGRVSMKFKTTKGVFNFDNAFVKSPVEGRPLVEFRIPSFTFIVGAKEITRKLWVKSIDPNNPIEIDETTKPVYLVLSNVFAGGIDYENMVVRKAGPDQTLDQQEFSSERILFAKIARPDAEEGEELSYVYQIEGLDQYGLHALEFLPSRMSENYSSLNPFESIKAYIKVVDPNAPKPIQDLELKETIVLEAGSKHVIDLKKQFEQANVPDGLFRVRVNASEPEEFDGRYEFTVAEGETVYQFSYTVLEGTGDRVYLFYELTVRGVRKTTENTGSTNVDTRVEATQPSVPSTPVPSATDSNVVEYNDENVRKALEDSKKGGSDHVVLHNPSKQDKVIAKLTPQSLKVLTDTGVVLFNDVAQLIFPPEAKKFVSEEKALTISMERKDPTKQVGQVDMKTAISVVEVKMNSGDEPVTEFGGESITIHLPAGDMYKVGRAYRVIVVSDDGTVEEALGVCKMFRGTKVISVPTMHLSTFILTSELKAEFKDIPENAWFEEGAKFTYERGILVSPNKEKFEGFSKVSRINIVVALHRLAGKPVAEKEASYTDTKQGEWYSNALNWATEKGIVDGRDDGSFGLHANVTREQFLVMLHRYAEKMQILLPQTKDIKVYEDSDMITGYAKDAIQWAGTAKLAEGSNGKIMPQGALSKAEIATILTRFVKTYEAIKVETDQTEEKTTPEITPETTTPQATTETTTGAEAAGEQKEENK